MALKSSKSVCDLVDMIISRAPELIAVGVTSLSVDGLSVTLVAPPSKTESVAPPKDEAARGHIDPMRDPSTYPGGRIPGFDHPEEYE